MGEPGELLFRCSHESLPVLGVTTWLDLWHRGLCLGMEESIISPWLPRNVDLRLNAEKEEQQMFHEPSWVFCRSAGFPLVGGHNYLIRSIKNTKYLKLLFLPNLAYISEQQKMRNKKPDMSPWFHQSLLEPAELLSYIENMWTRYEIWPWPNQGRCLGGKKNTPVPFLILFSETVVVF